MSESPITYRPASSGLAATFVHAGVADAYRHRAPYPAEVFDILTGLITDRPSSVLDIGAGEGALARPLAAMDGVDAVDAVDISEAMVAAGRARPGGQRDNLRWTVGAVESCELHGPYALVTAGASLHWMDWKPLMARLSAVMTDGAFLAVIEHDPHDLPWNEEALRLVRRHSRSLDFDPRFSLVDTLCAEGHLELAGQVETAPVTFRQSVADYIEQFHSRSSLARELMPAEEAAEFDRAIEEAVRPWAVDGHLDLPIVAGLAWGRPLTGAVPA